jgi:hypothetical protein
MEYKIGDNVIVDLKKVDASIAIYLYQFQSGEAEGVIVRVDEKNNSPYFIKFYYDGSFIGSAYIKEDSIKSKEILFLPDSNS